MLNLLVCSFILNYPPMLLGGLRDIRVNENYAYQGFYWWNSQIITMQRCDEWVFQHELAHHIMKKVGWNLRRSQKHDFVFYATLEYEKSFL